MLQSFTNNISLMNGVHNSSIHVEKDSIQHITDNSFDLNVENIACDHCKMNHCVLVVSLRI